MEQFLLSPFSLLPFSFSLSGFLCAHRVFYCGHSASSVILLHNYVDQCKRARVRKGQKFIIWMFSHFFLYRFHNIQQYMCVFLCCMDAYLRVLFPFLFVQLLFSVVCWYRCFKIVHPKMTVYLLTVVSIQTCITDFLQ